MPNEKANWPGWETIRLIGQGSFGAVYEIQREVLGDVEKAALKVITIPQNNADIDEMVSDGYDSESITSTFKAHLKNIVAEYSMMRKMNGSSNIVNCDDVRYVQHDDGIGWDIYIKMELLTPLNKALPVQVDEETVIKVGRDLCSALELCRKHDIVHRDIKPQNIFVSENGDYKLGDFGIARTMEKTMGGTRIGTIKFMAPEVYNNQPYGSASDIYAVGLVLYWLLNQRRMPFLPLPPARLNAGMEEQAGARRLSGEQIPAPATGSAELQRIVLKACAFDPRNRYTTAAEMLADLRKLEMAFDSYKTIATADPEATTVLLPEDNYFVQPIEEKTTLLPPEEPKSAPSPTPVKAETKVESPKEEFKSFPKGTPEFDPVMQSSAAKECEEAKELPESAEQKPVSTKRKKHKYLILGGTILAVAVVVLLITFISNNALLASGNYGDNITWKLSISGVLTINGTGDMLLIGKVEEIPWYDYRNHIRVISISNGITNIDPDSFQNHVSLIQINIPEGVKTIGGNAFSGCSNLTKISIPESVTNIYGYAFRSCSSLTRISIPEGVEFIYDSAFSDCSSLSQITVLNKDCVISDRYERGETLGVPGTTTIRGYKGSTAQAYAEKCGYTFEPLD